MKKIILLIPIIGLIIACSSETEQTEESLDVIQKQTEAIEESTQKLDEIIISSDAEMKKTQNEIDTLLNNI